MPFQRCLKVVALNVFIFSYLLRTFIFRLLISWFDHILVNTPTSYYQLLLLTYYYWSKQFLNFCGSSSYFLEWLLLKLLIIQSLVLLLLLLPLLLLLLPPIILQPLSLLPPRLRNDEKNNFKLWYEIRELWRTQQTRDNSE